MTERITHSLAKEVLKVYTIFNNVLSENPHRRDNSVNMHMTFFTDCPSTSAVNTYWSNIEFSISIWGPNLLLLCESSSRITITQALSLPPLFRHTTPLSKSAGRMHPSPRRPTFICSSETKTGGLCLSIVFVSKTYRFLQSNKCYKTQTCCGMWKGHSVEVNTSASSCHYFAPVQKLFV